MASDARPRYAFGPFVLDTGGRQLLRYDQPVAITARVFDILCALVEAAGEPLDKRQLTERVWGRVVVEEGNLARNVSTLRRILEESPDERRYIATLFGRGYQFVAPVRVLEPPVEPADSTAARIAVLPFVNLGRPEDAYFSAGMTEELTARLARSGALRVVSRTSAAAFAGCRRPVPEIGREPGVDYLLEGSVRWQRRPDGQERLRVTVQLIRVADDVHLWSDSYERNLRDVFALQSEIAIRVARELRLSIEPAVRPVLERAPTRNLQACHAYLQGTLTMARPDPSEESIRRAVRCFERAVALDPQFPLAWARLARAHERMVRLGYDGSAARRLLAHQAVARAEALGGDPVEVQTAWSAYWLGVGRDAEQALRCAERALSLQPRAVDARYLKGFGQLQLGRWEEAAGTLEQAQEVDPHNANLPALLALVLVGLHRHAEAEHAIEQSLAIESDQLLAYLMGVWNAWVGRGDLVTARARIEALPPLEDWRCMEVRFLQALYEGRFEQALEVLEPFAGEWMRAWILARPVVLFEAQAWQLLGDAARAEAAYERAAELLEAQLLAEPGDGRLMASWAIALAGLGRREEALRQACQAVAAMPYPRAFDAATVREDAALARCMAGDRRGARKAIETLLAEPAHFSSHLLRLDPRWAPLHGRPKVHV